MGLENFIAEPFRGMHYIIANKQRQHEIDAGLGTIGTKGYEERGCYGNCKGYNKDCVQYFSYTIYLVTKGEKVE